MQENSIIKRFMLETFIVVSITRIVLINFYKSFSIVSSIRFSFKLTFLYSTIRDLSLLMFRNFLFSTIFLVLILSQREQTETLLL